ncbi:MAG TPA: Slp family lipoprotein [Xanthomonadales bacterium]|nr:Slp family lipoprotein [Xanthomonadales bacterium]
MNRLALVALAVLATAGCASAPRPLQGEYLSGSPERGYADGERVRWGGEIISVETRAAETCFQVLSRELSESARPRRGDTSAGRFLACREGFYDPAVFTEGREVTVNGRVAGRETRRIGDYDYPLPRIAADVVYLWPERPLFDDYAYRYHRGPFLYPGWGWYGPHYPIWYRPWGWR